MKIPHSCQLPIYSVLIMPNASVFINRETYIYSHEETFLFALNSQKITYISSDAAGLLQGNPKDSFCYLGCLSETHQHNDCPRHFSSIPMDSTALPGGSRDFTEFWAAAHDYMALMPASLGLSATLKPRIPETLNMGNELNSLHSFVLIHWNLQEKFPYIPKLWNWHILSDFRRLITVDKK